MGIALEWNYKLGVRSGEEPPPDERVEIGRFPIEERVGATEVGAVRSDEAVVEMRRLPPKPTPTKLGRFRLYPVDEVVDHGPRVFGAIEDRTEHVLVLRRP